MRAAAWCTLASLLVTAGPLAAVDKILPLSQEVAVKLRGKTVLVTRHERPALIVPPGKRLIRQKELTDPTDVLEAALVPVLIDHFGMLRVPGDTPRIAMTDPREIASSASDVDYVLDVRTGGWSFSSHLEQPDRYWVGYSAQIQLIDTRARRRVSNLACNANTFQHAQPPDFEALVENRARLLKDVSTALAWLCVQLFAREQFQLPPDLVPSIPEPFVDPVMAYFNQREANAR